MFTILKIVSHFPLYEVVIAFIRMCHFLFVRWTIDGASGCKMLYKIKQQFDLAKINNNIKDLKDVVTSWIICLLEFSDDDFNLWCNVPELYFY